MPNLSPVEKLDLIAFTGIAIDEHGQLADLMGYPISADPSLQDHKQTHRNRFTEEDKIALTTWLAKAAAEGISLKGSRFWDNLQRTVC